MHIVAPEGKALRLEKGEKRFSEPASVWLVPRMAVVLVWVKGPCRPPSNTPLKQR